MKTKHTITRARLVKEYNFVTVHIPGMGDEEYDGKQQIREIPIGSIVMLPFDIETFDEVDDRTGKAPKVYFPEKDANDDGYVAVKVIE